MLDDEHLRYFTSRWDVHPDGTTQATTSVWPQHGDRDGDRDVAGLSIG